MGLRPLIRGLGLILLLTVLAPSAGAQNLTSAYRKPSSVGLGIILGDPTGFTFKWRLTEAHALQLHLGFGVGGANDGGTASFVFDYAYHFSRAIPPLERAGWLVPYLGIGAKVSVKERKDSARAGIRVPFGLAFFVRGAPVEIFLEIAIGMHIAPATSALVDGGLGARWHF